MSETTPAETVVIAVLTFRRPEDIALALPRLAAQALDAQAAARVLVIDNDPDASAREAVQAAAAESAARVDYVHEPRPGIAAARNRALREAADASLLVFIDDDEVPAAGWLNHLLQTYRDTGAAAVVGPVISEFAAEPGPWIQAGDFFRRRRLPTGTEVDVAATNNLLLDMERIRALDLEFDERFGLSGGSDTLFTRSLAARGGRMVWCDEAVVVDNVPRGRLTRGWVLRRALRSGNSASRVTLELSRDGIHTLAARLRLLGPGTVRLAGGSLRYAVGLLSRSLSHEAKGLRTAARGLGMVSGAFGYVYAEYRRK
ncbi:hypothetical protein NCCP1664_11710 [Zafaria cholistanensis]|uniref:Glycosyltransferase 2-like domain-containing protein n=1 Tax=Zafaria cholistanensis TaxID=1682741 RepID=A0A5A7NP36_9MICC|nr:glycosyltransferase [Zafaria cholistanensis]GER22674.1 hypothetical protein NCCP1664_11710 [Zafaria cholistanensis]